MHLGSGCVVLETKAAPPRFLSCPLPEILTAKTHRNVCPPPATLAEGPGRGFDLGPGAPCGKLATAGAWEQARASRPAPSPAVLGAGTQNTARGSGTKCQSHWGEAPDSQVQSTSLLPAWTLLEGPCVPTRSQNARFWLSVTGRKSAPSVPHPPTTPSLTPSPSACVVLWVAERSKLHPGGT